MFKILNEKSSHYIKSLQPLTTSGRKKYFQKIQNYTLILKIFTTLYSS